MSRKERQMFAQRFVTELQNCLVFVVLLLLFGDDRRLNGTYQILGRGALI